jgi:hypothetical protein
MKALLLALAATLAAALAPAGAQTAERLYVMDCGHNSAKDQSLWSPGIDVGKPIEQADTCSLIKHGSQWLLWDTGYADAITDTLLEGDYDVFGDGSVMLLSTPGHTPGHQSLLVHLARSGWILLAGDAAHFQDNWDNDRVPSINTSAEQTHASRARLAKILAEKNAQLWINHDLPTFENLKHSPQFYD